MYEIETFSGTTYTIHNGRITRKGDAPNPYLPPDHVLSIPVIVNERFIAPNRPTVGERFRFTVPGERGFITTSPVVAIRRSI